MSKILIHEKKAYELVENDLYASWKEIPDVAVGAPGLFWKKNKIPWELWRKIVTFCKWSFDRDKDEALVHLFYNPDEDAWGAWAPPQKGWGMTVKQIDCDEYKEQRRAWPEPWFQCGSVHHHCAGGAGHSGVDDKDEFDRDGIHITLGNLDKNPIGYHARAVFDRGWADTNLATWVDGPFGGDIPGEYLRDIYSKILLDLGHALMPIEEVPEQWRINFCMGHNKTIKGDPDVPRKIQTETYQNNNHHHGGYPRTAGHTYRTYTHNGGKYGYWEGGRFHPTGVAANGSKKNEKTGDERAEECAKELSEEICIENISMVNVYGRISTFDSIEIVDLVSPLCKNALDAYRLHGYCDLVLESKNGFVSEKYNNPGKHKIMGRAVSQMSLILTALHRRLENLDKGCLDCYDRTYNEFGLLSEYEGFDEGSSDKDVMDLNRAIEAKEILVFTDKDNHRRILAALVAHALEEHYDFIEEGRDAKVDPTEPYGIVYEVDVEQEAKAK